MANETGGKPIAVSSQSILGVRAVYPLVRAINPVILYVVFFCFVSKTTRDIDGKSIGTRNFGMIEISQYFQCCEFSSINQSNLRYLVDFSLTMLKVY
jgi:hypothetical protein